MNVTRLVARLLFLTLISIFLYLIYSLFFAKPEERLYSTHKIEYRNINYIIRASGKLEAEEFMKIGSLVAGIIEKMYVEENDIVKKGQLLARINDGKEDTDVRATKAAYEIAQQELTYEKAHFARQKTLHEAHFIADDEFEQNRRDYESAVQNVDLKKAQFDAATLVFNNKRITAPADGIVVGKPSNEGETVTLYAPPTVIYSIAKDIAKMEAQIEIDESNVGVVKKGTPVLISFSTYLGDVFKSTITDISNNPIEKGGSVCFLATAPLDNSKQLLKPGMTVDAEIVIAKKEHILALQAQQFSINPTTIEMIAKIKNYQYKPVSLDERSTCLKKGFCKTVWIEKDKSFIERPIKTGISDGAYFEILEGLDQNDLVVIDTIEENAAEKFFKKIFKTGLQ